MVAETTCTPSSAYFSKLLLSFCYRVGLNERKLNASFYSIFDGAGKPKWRLSNFPRFRKN